jgi:hypothetical protein
MIDHNVLAKDHDLILVPKVASYFFEWDPFGLWVTNPDVYCAEEWNDDKDLALRQQSPHQNVPR